MDVLSRKSSSFARGMRSRAPRHLIARRATRRRCQSNCNYFRKNVARPIASFDSARVVRPASDCRAWALAAVSAARVRSKIGRRSCSGALARRGGFLLAWRLTLSSASNPNRIPQRKLKIYATRSPLSVPLRIRFGIVGCDVLRNTSKDWAVVDGIAAMAENVGALRDVFWAPWHSRHVASANCFPAAGSPTCWPKAMPMFTKRSGALHADERTGIIGASFGANVFTGYPQPPVDAPAIT